ncbi:MFS transporter [Microbacter margulisiae]|uniref:Fucose permease n=1 Tax=Microbacter margulisiae TaxID=1350067 RepID=A0A7W5DTP7_9PORP|nr:MFS transporter [Microbacter margulisiae]MBB3188535.1 fucose permease [Microbacter margulisiae]
MYNKKLVFLAACIGMAFFGVAFIVMGSVLPLLTQKYNLDEIGASSLVTFLPIGILLGSLIFGPIVDRFGYKKLLVVSSLITIIGIEGLTFFDKLNVLRSCIFLIGFGGGILNGETNALTSNIYDDHERGAKLSLLGFFYGLGALGIPLLLGVLSKIYSYEVILKGTGVVMLLSVVYFLFIQFPRPKQSQSLSIRESFALIKAPALLLFSFILFFQSGMEGLCNNWTTLYLSKTTSISSDKTVFILTFFVTGMVLARLLMSYILLHLKSFLVLYTGMLIALSGFLLLYFSASFTMAAISLFLIGFGLAEGFPLVLSFVGNTYKELSGTAFSIALFIALVGNSLLNYLMGFVAKTFDFTVFPLFLAINLILQAIILFVALRLFIYKN